MADGIYIHIPFCKSRCSYCDFATDVYRDQDSVERYVAALCAEIEHSAAERRPIDTLYFGGGTPSLLNAGQLERIVAAVRRRFEFADDIEITLEMNPATVTPGKLRDLRAIGVNRASFGVQTFNDRDLKLLARGHDAADARATFEMLRDGGFGNVSFDLIAGLPGQSIADWKSNLTKAIDLGPEHLSLYLLEIHEGTPLAAQLRAKRRPMPDEELAAEMYEMMVDVTDKAGLKQYEISNFARPGFESRHNAKYWKLEPVLGFGVSAHSFDGRDRFANERSTDRYVELVAKNGSAEVFREPADLESEFVFLGLRMTDGVDLAEYAGRFGKNLTETRSEAIERLRSIGLVELDGQRLRLTRRGALFSNEVFAEFI